MEAIGMEDRAGRLRLAGTKELHVLPDVQTTFQLFAAHLRRVATPWTYPSHTHAMFELNVVTEGIQRFTIESRTFEQRPGDITFVRSGERHASVAHCSEAMSYFCLHFQADDSVLRRLLLGFDQGMYRKGSPLEERIGPALRRLMELATTEADTDTAALRMQTLSAVYGLLAAIAEGATDQPPERVLSSQTARLAASIAESIEQSVTHGEEHEAEGGIADIARTLGYSAAYCGRVFRDAYGMSPRAYRSSIILREAKLLLLNLELTIESIAAKLRYDDAATFSKQFRRWTGMSPRDYRTL
jgi:AraC family transcriptional activator of pobA